MPDLTPHKVDATPLLNLIGELKSNATFGKHKHFFAADRSRHWGTAIGVTVSLINLFLGSVLFTSLGESIGQAKALGMLLSFLAAALGVLLSAFKFSERFQGHRSLGNKYLEIARDCERLAANFQAGLLTPLELSERIEELNKTYNQVNEEAESLPTSERDYTRAKRIIESKRIAQDRDVFPEPERKAELVRES